MYYKKSNLFRLITHGKNVLNLALSYEKIFERLKNYSENFIFRVRLKDVNINLLNYFIIDI